MTIIAICGAGRRFLTSISVYLRDKPLHPRFIDFPRAFKAPKPPAIFSI